MDPTQPQLPLDNAPSAARRPRRQPAPTAAPGPPPPSAVAPDADQAPLLLTVRDVEAALQLGRTRTYELVRSGELPVVRVGRVVRVPREGLLKWIYAHSSESAPGAG